MTAEEQQSQDTRADAYPMTGLPPCPFCGGPAHLAGQAGDHDDPMRVECADCYASGPEVGVQYVLTHGERAGWAYVIEGWRRRTAPSGTEQKEPSE